MLDFLNAIFPFLADYPFLGAVMATMFTFKLFIHLLDIWTYLFRPRKW